MTVSEHQLAFDFDALARLVEQLRERRYIETGAPRLLETLVRRGLDERALVSAAALVVALDEPHNRQDARGGAATPTSGQPSNAMQKGAASI